MSKTNIINGIIRHINPYSIKGILGCKTYLDISEVQKNLEKAKQVGVEANQIAIFDLKNFKEPRSIADKKSVNIPAQTQTT